MTFIQAVSHDRHLASTQSFIQCLRSAWNLISLLSVFQETEIYKDIAKVNFLKISDHISLMVLDFGLVTCSENKEAVTD